MGSQLSYWLLLAVNHIAAAMMTSMGAFLTAMLFGITALVVVIRYRSWSILWKTVLHPECDLSGVAADFVGERP